MQVTSITQSPPGPLQRLWVRLYGLRRFVLAAAVVLIIWEAAALLLKIPSYLLPPPDMILRKLVERFPLLLHHTVATGKVMLTGYIVAILVSVPFALAIAFSRFLEETVFPIVVWVQIIPKIAIAPLFIIWFGFGMLPRVVLVFMICFFPILVNSIAGFRSINPEIMDFARSTGARGWDVFRRIRLPAALPQIFVGFKIAAVLSTTAAVVSEFVASDEGLGFLLLRFNGDLDTASSFAAILMLTSLGMTLFYGMERLEPRRTLARIQS